MPTKSSKRKPATPKSTRTVKAAQKRIASFPSSEARKSRPLKANPASVAATPLAVSSASKQSQLIALLRTGASIAQMKTLTGWQAHTLRGTISGVLRKKMGLNVCWELPPDSTERVYRIVDTARA